MKKTITYDENQPALTSEAVRIIAQQKEFDSNNLKALINNTDDPIWSVNRDLQLITCNKAFDEATAGSLGKPVAKGDHVLASGYTPEKLTRWADHYYRALSGESFTETEYHDQPVENWSEISFYPIYNEEEVVGVACYSRDITERKKASEQLLKIHQENTAILESITDGFYTVDKNWIVTYWNKEAERILGQPKESILGRNIWDVYSNTIPLKFYSETHKALSLKEPVSFEEFYAPLNIWIDVSAYPSGDGLAIYFKNITERKLTEGKIKEAKERYEMVARATNDAIYEWDINAKTVYWNEGYETLFGHQRTGEIMPVGSWKENLHPDEREQLIADADNAFEKKLTSLSRELQFRCADGSYKIVFDKLIIEYDTDDHPARVIGAMQDITERKNNETAIRELNEELNKRADDLVASNAELERFAYVASHDLQEPLRMVSSFLQLLQKKYKGRLDETAEQYIGFAVDGADRMKRLILDLLEYSRIGTHKEGLVDTDISGVVRNVLETFSAKIEETGARVNVQLMPVIRASKVQMTQVFQNLVGNSFKYNTSAIPQIEIGFEDKGNAWQFFVKDNGIGVEEKFFDKIFIIFQRLHNKNQFSGTGIGLAICKKIVERHGGTIWIESRVGEGSIFFFTISK